MVHPRRERHLHWFGFQDNFVYGAGGDAGIIEITNRQLLQQIAACACSWVVVLASPQTSTNGRYSILRDDTSVVNMRVCHTGATTGTNCGRVEMLGVGGFGGVRNLAQANYCSNEGDSGGPVYSGNTAYGLHHGSRGYCLALYQGVRGAENLMNVDVVFDRASTPGRHTSVTTKIS